MPQNWAVIFDLDGVLTDTAELHYQSWQTLADDLGLPFNRQTNEQLRGLSREESLAIVLGPHASRFSREEKSDLTRRKNDDYLRRVARMSPADLAPGAAELLADLREAGARLAIASSSRNAAVVLERLGIAAAFDAVVDGNIAPQSKPDPACFRVAAERLGVAPARCVVIEDAASGVAAARAAGMRVVGLGPRERVGDADHVCDCVSQLSADVLQSLANARRSHEVRR